MNSPEPSGIIRREQPDDIEAVFALNAAAFPAPDEAKLVDRLRDAERATVSLVAELGGEIVGHILFSPVTIDGAEGPWLGLAPMAVAREFGGL